MQFSSADVLSSFFVNIPDEAAIIGFFIATLADEEWAAPFSTNWNVIIFDEDEPNYLLIS